MGIIILPIMLAVLFLLIPGIGLAAKGFLTSNNKLAFLLFLVLLIVVLHALEYLSPFILFHGESINPFAFFMLLFSFTVIPAVVIGFNMKKRFKSSAKQIYSVAGSALFISGGITPFTWFSYGESLGKVFEIRWLY